jgi:threonine dehydrogenase-like Zn-dependent dehydrogenase
VRSGQVKTGELITHRFPLDRIREGFETQLDPGNSIKVVITPWSGMG